jgi:estrogen-related receptor ERR
MGMLKEGVRLDRVRGGRQKYRRLMDNSYSSMSLNGPQKPPLTLDDNKLLNSLISCEPETVLALPDSSVPDDEKITQTLSNLYEKQLVGIIEWAKQIPGFTDLSLNDQMRLLQGSWSEVLTLSLIFRTLPTTVAAATASAKESEAGLRRRLKFAPDFALTEAMALQIDLEEFYNHCVNILDRSDRLGLRREEYLILKAILVSNCDVQIEEATALRKLRDNLLASLHDCVAVIRSGNTSVHVQNLLLLLPSIRQADAMIRWFWLKIRQERKIPLKKLMVEMLDVSVDKICMQKLKSSSKKS